MTKTPQVPAQYHAGFLASLDGRTEIAKVMRERWENLTDDLGGAENLSYPQRSLVERSLWLEHHLIQLEQALASGAEFDSSKWVSSCNSLLGIYNKLGIERRARDVGDLHEYLSGLRK